MIKISSGRVGVEMRPFVAGWAAAALVAVTLLLATSPGHPERALLLVAAIAAISHGTTVRSRTHTHYQLNEVTVGATAVLAPTAAGVLAMLVGLAAVELLLPRARMMRAVFNLSVYVLSATAGLAAVQGLGRAGIGPKVLAAGLATGIFSLACAVIIPAAVARHEHRSYVAELRAALPATGATVVIGVLGGMLFGGLAAASRPALAAAAAIAVPVMLWSNARERTRLHRNQLQEALDSVAALHLSPDSSHAEQRLLATARRLTGASRAWLQSQPPAEPRLTAVPLQTAGGSRWLVADVPPTPVLHLTARELLAALAPAAGAALTAAELTDQLQQQAAMDALTGLANRRAFDHQLQVELARATRSGETLVVCYLDLDAFKPVNDTHGHETGDELLRAVAAAMAAELRSGDVAARLGGDEFALLLTDLPSAHDAPAAVARIVEAVRRVSVAAPDGSRVAACCSVGTASYPADGSTATELLTTADARMYGQKRAGRDRP